MALAQKAPIQTEPGQTQNLHKQGPRAEWICATKALTHKSSTQRGPKRRGNLNKQGLEQKAYQVGPGLFAPTLAYTYKRLMELPVEMLSLWPNKFFGFTPLHIVRKVKST